VSGKSPSQRQLRVGELIRHELAAIFAHGDVADALIDHAGVTIVEVQLSADLRLATVYVRPFIPGREDAFLAALDRHRRHIRRLLAPRLDLKFMPDLRFRLDTALDYAAHVEEILNRPEVRRDLERRDPEPDRE
jgi:ribosome-binding factor A